MSGANAATRARVTAGVRASRWASASATAGPARCRRSRAQPRHPRLREHQRVHEIIDVQHVAHLEAVAVDVDPLARERTPDEMRDPALVFRSHLTRSINAAHAENDRGQTVAACVVDHVLVGHAFGTAVGAAEVEGARLVDTLSPAAARYRRITRS